MLLSGELSNVYNHCIMLCYVICYFFTLIPISPYKIQYITIMTQPGYKLFYKYHYIMTIFDNYKIKLNYNGHECLYGFQLLMFHYVHR